MRSTLPSLLFCTLVLTPRVAAQSPDPTRVYGLEPLPADSVREYLRGGRNREALAVAQRWATSEPDQAAAHHAVALAALALRQTDLALREAELSVLLAPTVAAHHVALGRAWFDIATGGDTPATREAARKSREAFDQAIELDSLNLDAREYLFTYHLVAPVNTGASRAAARRLAAEMSRINRARGMWAELRLASTLGPDEAIRSAVVKAIDLAASDTTGLVMATLATTAGSARYPSMRETLVQMVFTRFPDDPRARFQRARLWVTQAKQLGDAEKLLIEYVAAASLPPRSPSRATAMWWLGQGYEKQGRRDAARETYRACAALNPTLNECIRDANRLSGSSAR